MPFWQYCLSLEYSQHLSERQPDYFEILDEIKKNPHPKTVEMFTYL
jgi:hypothetical protein